MYIFQKIPLKKATDETSWEIIVLTSSIPLYSFRLEGALFLDPQEVLEAQSLENV